MKPTAERLAQLFGSANLTALPTEMPLPAGVEALPVVAPADLDLARDVLEVASREHWRILPAGAGEHLGRAGPLPDVDLILSASRMRAVVEYEPAEMVLEAEAGMSLRELDARVAPHGQRLASDPWPGHAATIGGAVAGNRAGLNRRRAGTLRDALLGARVLQADGQVSKTGGKVVKNVAGYDLGKLYVGSCGSLAFLHRVTLRLVSRPETSALVVAFATRSEAATALLAVHRAAVEPTALLAVAGTMGETIGRRDGDVAIVTRFEGREAVVRQQVDATCRILAGEVWRAERADIAYDALRAACEPRADAVSLRLSTLPVAGTALLDDLEPLAAWQRGGGCIIQFGVGTSHAALPGLTGREFRALRQAVAARGGRVAVEHAPAGLVPDRETRPDPVGLDLCARTQAAYDAAGLWCPAPPGSPVR